MERQESMKIRIDPIEPARSRPVPTPVGLVEKFFTARMNLDKNPEIELELVIEIRTRDFGTNDQVGAVIRSLKIISSNKAPLGVTSTHLRDIAIKQVLEACVYKAVIKGPGKKKSGPITNEGGVLERQIQAEVPSGDAGLQTAAHAAQRPIAQHDIGVMEARRGQVGWVTAQRFTRPAGNALVVPQLLALDVGHSCMGEQQMPRSQLGWHRLRTGDAAAKKCDLVAQCGGLPSGIGVARDVPPLDAKVVVRACISREA